MGRIASANDKPRARKGLMFAMIAASTALSVSAFADVPTAKVTAPAKAKTSVSASKSTSKKSTAPKVAKAAPLPGECGPSPDQASIGLRALQTELMVAGLKCSADQWNNFTAKFKATIKIDADRMQKVFTKAYGKGGATQMNAFVTQLANDASQRSNAFSESEYCKRQDVLFTKVLALSALELERFSAKRIVNVPQPVAMCLPDPEPSVTTTASATVPPGAVPAVATGAKPTATPIVATAAPTGGSGTSAR